MTQQESFELLVECRNVLDFIEATLRSRNQETDKPMLNAIDVVIRKLPLEGTGG
jgi:hypothetical protein